MSVREALTHAAAGTIAGVIAFAFLYPLDNIRTRLQVQINTRKLAPSDPLPPPSIVKCDSGRPCAPASAAASAAAAQTAAGTATAAAAEVAQKLRALKDDAAAGKTDYKSALDCAIKVIRREGWSALYNGLSSGLVGVGVSNAIYFWWYFWIKRLALRVTGKRNLTPLQNIAIAMVAGTINITMTSPIWVINTRMALQKNHNSKTVNGAASTAAATVKTGATNATTVATSAAGAAASAASAAAIAAANAASAASAAAAEAAATATALVSGSASTPSSTDSAAAAVPASVEAAMATAKDAAASLTQAAADLSQAASSSVANAATAATTAAHNVASAVSSLPSQVQAQLQQLQQQQAQQVQQQQQQQGGPRYTGIIDACQKIIKEEGIEALYRGFLPSLFLVTNPATQFAVYEQLSRLVLRRRARAAAAAGADGATPSATAALAAAAAKLSPIESFVIGAIAKAVATVVTYPYQVVKARQQADTSPAESAPSMWAVMSEMYAKEGAGAFVAGMGAKLSQTVSNSAFMFLLYEEILAVIVRTTGGSK